MPTVVAAVDGARATLDLSGYPTSSMSPCGVLGVPEYSSLHINSFASSVLPVTFTAPFVTVQTQVMSGQERLHSEQTHNITRSAPAQSQALSSIHNHVSTGVAPCSVFSHGGHGSHARERQRKLALRRVVRQRRR